MSPKPKKVIRVVAPKPEPWDGANRRAPRPPKKLDWRPTVVGVLLIAAGVAVHVLLRERLDLVPLALIIVGGAMVDKEAVRAASKMFSIRRGSSDTEEHPSWSRGE